jgi:leucyl aminopeptidase
MKTKISLFNDPTREISAILLVKDLTVLKTNLLNQEEIEYISHQNSLNKIRHFSFNRLNFQVFVRIFDPEKSNNTSEEKFRKAGDEFQHLLNKQKTASVHIHSLDATAGEVLAFAEGMALGNYQFIKYQSDKTKQANTLTELFIDDPRISENEITLLNITIDAVFTVRDLVNEPVNYLNAENLAERFVQMGKEAGVKTEVFEKKKIESLKMGGLLAVNKGSIDPPTFTVMEWKPENARNIKPVVLVGKGIVYDTGGLNLKSGSYMENMKMDMAGAAMMAATIYTAARAKLPYYMVALMPATDNRPNGNAFASGDVVTTFDGQTVEIINTDAEGRMILADALSYAKKYDPALVITAATLTGSAQRALGKYGAAAMQVNAPEELNHLMESGDCVYERLVQFPMWDEYADLLKSDIADMKNLGIPEAGMIIAGKFLEKFTSYPFIHLDIAGVAFAEKRDSYRNIGGTGFGVRLLFDFLKKMSTR